LENYQNERSAIISIGDKKIQVSYLWYPSLDERKHSILVLPGLDESIGDYHKFINELIKEFPKYSVLAIDLRGQGKTLENEGRISSYTISLDHQIEIIKGVTEYLSIKSLFLVGLSYGAGVSLYAANRIKNVEGLALLAPYVSKFKNFSDGFSGLWYTLVHLNPFYKIISHFTLPFYFQIARDRKRLNPNVEWTSRKLFALTKLSTGIMDISTSREAHALKELSLGVHFLLGERDDLVAINAVKHLYQKINCQNKTIRIIPQIGHRLLINNYSLCTKWLIDILNE